LLFLQCNIQMGYSVAGVLIYLHLSSNAMIFGESTKTKSETLV
jgi:hypothetical protein